MKNLLFYYLFCFLLPNRSFIEVNPFLFVRGSWQPWYVHTICKYSYGYLAFYRQQTSSSSTAHTLMYVYTVFFRIWNSANSLLQATSKQGRRNSHAFGCVVDELPPIPNPIPTQHVAQPGRATKKSEREREMTFAIQVQVRSEDLKATLCGGVARWRERGVGERGEVQ